MDGRTVTGYFGTYKVYTTPDNGVGGIRSPWEGDHNALLKPYNTGLYVGGGISNNSTGAYLFNGYGTPNGYESGKPEDAPGAKIYGVMIGDGMYTGFCTYIPMKDRKSNEYDILTMEPDERPKRIEFRYINGYETLAFQSAWNGEQYFSVPDIYLYPFKVNLDGYDLVKKQYVINSQNVQTIHYRRQLNYSPRNEGICIYNKGGYGVHPDAFVKDLPVSERGKLQGQALGIYRDGGTGWIPKWEGFHQVVINTEYVPYTVTIGQATTGSGIINEGNGVHSISLKRGEPVKLKAKPNQYYVSTGWDAPPNSISRTGENDYSFTMSSPAMDVTLTPTFKKQEFSITVIAPVGGTAECNMSTSEWGASPRLSHGDPNPLYRFDGWEVRDEKNNSINVESDGSFVMPTSAVTVMAHFLKHEIVYENSSLAVDQDNYTLTFTKNEDARDTFNETLKFELHRNGVKIADFNNNTAVVTLTDADVGVKYNYTVVACSETEGVTAVISTKSNYEVYRVDLAASPSEGGTVAAKCGAKAVSIAHPGKTITLEYVPDGLYVFNNWTAPDGVTITDENEFSMPSKNVTITAVFTKHKITWENASLTVKQNEYNLTFTKGGTVSDSNGISFSFKLLRNGVDLGVTFTEDTATYKMSDAEVEKEYEYTVIAYSLEDEVSTTGATITFRSQGVHKTIGYFDGTEFVPCIPYYYNGEDWVEVYPHYYDGTKWVLCSMT